MAGPSGISPAHDDKAGFEPEFEAPEASVIPSYTTGPLTIVNRQGI